jgi:hypothetical protein
MAETGMIKFPIYLEAKANVSNQHDNSLSRVYHTFATSSGVCPNGSGRLRKRLGYYRREHAHTESGSC